MNSQYKKALHLEYFTVVYNIIEAIASITFGSLANSIALVGFGLDSIVESLSGFVLIWRLQKHDKLKLEEEEKIEKRATIFVGVTFLVLAAYVLFESIKKIVTKEIPDPSLPGIIIAIVSIVVMPFLGLKKRNIGIILNLKSLIADAKETFVCSTLSIALLLGLAGRYFFNFWYADPIVGFIIVVYLVREGKELLLEEE